MKYLLSIAIVLGLTSCYQDKSSSAPGLNTPPNVLFISIDDLRPELASYGHPLVQSPNIDRLAAMGTSFDRAYCNVPVCGASRASLLTGLRPKRDRYTDYDTRISADMPGATTIPAHFKQHGYYTVGLGKIGHFRDDMKEQYSEPPWRPDFPYKEEVQGDWRDYKSAENQAISKTTANGRALPYESPDVPDSVYFDAITATRAVDYINQLSNKAQPFFLGVGFLKPHLPFNAPKRYWDLYNRDDIQLPDNYYVPDNAPKYSIHNNGELRQYYGVPDNGRVSDEMAQTMIHGYYACISYADAMVGKLLDALEANGQLENTIIILWGDHGWNLGEHTMWCKHCNYETSLRTPLIVHAPGLPKNQRTSSLVEYVDIFPSLTSLAGIPMANGLDGESFGPILRDPSTINKREVYARWKDAETIITDRYFYTAWYDDDGQQYADMLYDHAIDPDENINIAGLPSSDSILTELSLTLQEHIR